MVKRNKSRSEEKNRSESLRCYAFPSRDMAEFGEAILSRTGTFWRERSRLLGRDTSSGGSPLRLSES